MGRSADRRGGGLCGDVRVSEREGASERQCVCACVCARERGWLTAEGVQVSEREGERARDRKRARERESVCMCVRQLQIARKLCVFESQIDR